MKPSLSPSRNVITPRNHPEVAVALAAADTALAARHARGLARLLLELGHRGEATAAAHVADRLDRALTHLSHLAHA